MPRGKKCDESGAASKDAPEVRESGVEEARKEAPGKKGAKASSNKPRRKTVNQPPSFPRIRAGFPAEPFKHIDSPQRLGDRELTIEERRREFQKQRKKEEAKRMEANAVKRAERRTRRQIAKKLVANGVMTVEDIAECAELPVDSVKRIAREARRQARTNP